MNNVDITWHDKDHTTISPGGPKNINKHTKKQPLQQKKTNQNKQNKTTTHKEKNRLNNRNITPRLINLHIEVIIFGYMLIYFYII